MKPLFTLLTTLALVTAPAIGTAQQALIDAGLVVTEAESLAPFRWVSRPIVVFADSPNDPRYIQQLDLLSRRPEALAERDVVIITDTDPSKRSEVRLNLRPRGFSVVLIAKDGSVVSRKPAPRDVRELTRAIDKLPLRQQEIRDAKRAGGEG